MGVCLSQSRPPTSSRQSIYKWTDETFSDISDNCSKVEVMDVVDFWMIVGHELFIRKVHHLKLDWASPPPFPTLCLGFLPQWFSFSATIFLYTATACYSGAFSIGNVDVIHILSYQNICNQVGSCLTSISPTGAVPWEEGPRGRPPLHHGGSLRSWRQRVACPAQWVSSPSDQPSPADPPFQP